MAGVSEERFARFNECIADIIAAGDRGEVPALLARACNALLPSHDCLVAVFGRQILPVWLYDNVPPEDHDRVIKKYQAGHYLLDPFYRAAVDGIDSGLYRLRDVAPTGFRQSQYYKEYYESSEAGDEAAFLFRFPGERVGYIGLLNTSDQPNHRQVDVDTLRLAKPVIERLFADYWTDVGHSRDDSSLHSQLETALDMFGDSVLTARESQVLRLYLKGHSTGSIAERLDISKHTVALHRKNAYAKLDIGSQFELFHLFIDSLTCYDADEPEDPLRTYLSARR
jgi:DNA-binding CsgD family transcriptional regulator